ncbi:MAG TPA: extracellular solute-binding protein [Gemmatimonadales bacterium]|nr:extracellular solute-binding protein [Gemmatimonadales bacterium]
MDGKRKGGKVGKDGKDAKVSPVTIWGWLRSVLTYFRHFPAFPVLPVFLVTAACSADNRTPVVLYSPHGRDQLTLLEHAFERHRPDIDVRWLDMGSQEILDRLRFERVNPQADVWFGGPGPIFQRGTRDSLLIPYRPSWAGRVDPKAVGAGDLYFPVYRTPAVIAFNSRAVSRAEAPRDWDEVLEPRWKNKVIIRDPMASGTMRAIWGLILMRSLRQTGDTAKGMAWLRQLDGQTKTYTINPALLYEKLVRQEGLVSLWDLQDILISAAKGMPLGYVFPRSGTVVIEDAIGLVRGSRHPDAARAFIDFVGGEEAQLLAAREVFRLPARDDLPRDSVPYWVTEVNREMIVADMDWDLLSRQGAEWMSYWDQHVRATGKR